MHATKASYDSLVRADSMKLYVDMKPNIYSLLG